ncbi:hypothetical protein [Tsukamurella tyrosinosolvens]|uniref:hypothetical protein n=1 Tax=Tsukamurella tyrosinosolvens TaxID=57704 RepID=UPI003462CC1A
MIALGIVLAYFTVGIFGVRIAANNFYKYNKTTKPNQYGNNWDEVDSVDRVFVCVAILLFWPVALPAHLVWWGTQGRVSVNGALSRFFVPQAARDRKLLEKAADLDVLANEMLKAGETELSASLMKTVRELQREAKG